MRIIKLVASVSQEAVRVAHVQNHLGAFLILLKDLEQCLESPKLETLKFLCPSTPIMTDLKREIYHLADTHSPLLPHIQGCITAFLSLHARCSRALTNSPYSKNTHERVGYPILRTSLMFGNDWFGLTVHEKGHSSTALINEIRLRESFNYIGVGYVCSHSCAFLAHLCEYP